MIYDHLPVIVLISEIFIVLLFSLYLYRNIFNPLAIFACINVGLFTVGSYFNMIFFRLEFLDYPVNSLNHAVWISVIWLTAFSLSFLPVSKWIYHKYSLPIHLGLFKKNNYIPYYFILALVTIFSFIALCLSSNATEWLTNPRLAYAYHRVGVGHYYIGFVWSALILFTSILFFQRPKLWGLLIWVSIFVTILFFSGKKSIIISLFVIACLYYHFYIKNFSLLKSSLLALIIFLVLILLISVHSNQSFLSALSYFDYIDTTAKFLHRFDEFGYYLGYTFISEYWVLVPRMYFPEKPFDFGHSLIHAVLYPGLAESGHTSGYLMWSPYYLDFGLIGVFIYGFVLGIFKRYIFNKFLLNKNSFILFCLSIHFCFYEAWFYLPSALVILFFYICYKLSKIRIY